MAVTRITLRNWKPEKTWSVAGSGTEKPKLAKELVSLPTLMPPTPRPTAVEPQAISMPAAIATRPAGIPRG